MKKETTNVTMTEKGDASLKEAVIDILKWTDLGYGRFQMEQGEAYLNAYLPYSDKYSLPIDNILKSRIFWNWWKNHWALRDQIFLKLSILTERCNDTALFRKVYVKMNSANKLTRSIHPNRVVLEETYADMIQETIKQEVKK